MMAAIILAAGRSTRMGHSKPLLPYGGPGGPSFVAQLVDVLKTSGFSEILVVGRPGDAPLEAEAAGCGATFIENPDADRGQLSSLQAALTVLETRHGAQLEAVMVMPADAPLISTTAVKQLLLVADRSNAQIFRATHQGRHGHPVVFRRSTFAELHAADPNIGARAVVRADPERVHDVDVGEVGVTIDFDTPDQYRNHFGRLPFKR